MVRDLPPELIERLAKAFAAAIVKALRADDDKPVEKPAPEKPTERLLTAKDVFQIIPVHRQTIWSWVRKGQFPQPVKVSNARIFWRESAVLAWIAERERRPAPSRGYFGRPSPKRDAYLARTRGKSK